MMKLDPRDVLIEILRAHPSKGRAVTHAALTIHSSRRNTCNLPAQMTGFRAASSSGRAAAARLHSRWAHGSCDPSRGVGHYPADDRTHDMRSGVTGDMRTHRVEAA